ncbi:glutathione hydrolase 1 proenzyme-like [Contarinia nasturtii]|uniref:glutathione hydrolase 1 proenzyme-like n=1 Tax=Contarinia nasturtii TaxID=265458 RepID=UPI0012D3EEBB|nr:glutathione hydrolase 1 proenzyme-like [Contarinia nasturtii]
MIIPISKTKVFSLAAFIVLIIGCIWFVYQLKFQNSEHADQPDEFNRHAIVSNGPECAEIGMKILKDHNGTAVDAAISILFCEGITVSQSMGIGGGFIATVYNKESGKVDTILARERAPLASTENMFENMTTVTGILSVATPGELKGYGELHKKFGRVPWKTLIQPTIELCRSGHIVTDYLARVLELYRQPIFKSSSLSEVFVNPATNDLWKAGDKIRRLKLAETLEVIAKEGPDTMYTRNGTIAKLLVKEIQELKGILTIEDFVNYEVEWAEPVTTKLKGNYTLHSTGLPGSGLILALILNVMNGYDASFSVEYIHKMVESFKYGYAKRTFLGDLNYNKSFIDAFSDMKTADDIRTKISPDRTFNDYKHYGAEYSMEADHGTAHISVLSANGDAISITSTVNSIFGSKIRSKSTGIILNDEMDDFATPGKKNGFGLEPSMANFITPNKRPLSSMCPVIVIDKNSNAIFIAGSAGGSKIITTVAYIFAKHFWLGESLKDAIYSKRIHHQLLPMEISCEKGFNSTILEGLQKMGHTISADQFVTGFTAFAAISRVSGSIEAFFDPRRYGSIQID